MRRTALLLFAILITTGLILLAQTTQNKPAGTKAAASTAKPRTATARRLPTKAEVESFLQHTFGWDPGIKSEIIDIKPAADPAVALATVRLRNAQGQQITNIYVTPDGKHAITGDMIPFGSDPFASARAELARRANGPAKGPANAAVNIVEFGDLQCPACKAAQPTIQRLMSDLPQAKLIFQQFPLTQLHPWAMTAAKYGECVARQNKDAFWKYVDLVYANQDGMERMSEAEATPKLKDYAGQAGVNANTAAQCTQDPAIAAKIFASMELGRLLDVTGTPTLFIGGRKISSVSNTPYDALKAVAQYQAKQGK